MKILFVISEISFADHVAIAYLSAIAKELNHETFFCSLDQHNFLLLVKEIKPEVIAYSANIIGFDAIINQHKLAKKIHNFVSILGGPQATFSSETFEESGMDVYCIGEGELPFRDFLERVSKKESYTDVLNLITKTSANPVRPLITNFNELPLPDRDLTLANSHLKNISKKTFYFTRGCPYSCSYCCNNYYHKLYKGKGAIVRRFPVERVIKEMENVKAKYRMDFVKIGDDLFAMKADEWLEEFTEKYKKRIGLPFNCYLRIDFIDEKLLTLLKKAGCYSVHLSLDSTSEYVREKILNRKMKKVNIIENLKLLHTFGINTWLNHMLAVPNSKLEDDINSILLCKKGKVTYPHFSTTVPMKGTELYNYCVTNKFLNPDKYTGDMTGCSQKSSLSCFSEKEKNIRFNIYLLGALISKLPFPLDRCFIFLIKIIPANKFFLYLRSKMFKYYIENKIFKL